MVFRRSAATTPTAENVIVDGGVTIQSGGSTPRVQVAPAVPSPADQRIAGLRRRAAIVSHSKRGAIEPPPHHPHAGRTTPSRPSGSRTPDPRRSRAASAAGRRRCSTSRAVVSEDDRQPLGRQDHLWTDRDAGDEPVGRAERPRSVLRAAQDREPGVKPLQTRRGDVIAVSFPTPRIVALRGGVGSNPDRQAREPCPRIDVVQPRRLDAAVTDCRPFATTVRLAGQPGFPSRAEYVRRSRRRVVAQADPPDLPEPGDCGPVLERSSIAFAVSSARARSTRWSPSPARRHAPERGSTSTPTASTTPRGAWPATRGSAGPSRAVVGV